MEQMPTIYSAPSFITVFSSSTVPSCLRLSKNSRAFSPGVLCFAAIRVRLPIKRRSSYSLTFSASGTRLSLFSDFCISISVCPPMGMVLYTIRLFQSIAKKNNRSVVASGPVILLFALLKGCSLFLIHIIEHGGRKSITKVLRKSQTLIMFK